jgi:hypothetical protein
MDTDPAFKIFIEKTRGQDNKRKIDTFCKLGTVYDYFVEAEKDRLSEKAKDERDEGL